MRILIPGGGFAGGVAVDELRRERGDRAGITLIDDVSAFVVQPLPPRGGGAIPTRDAASPFGGRRGV